MEHASGLNNLDYSVLAILLISGLLALMRGLVREIFSLIAWVGAYLAAVNCYKLAIPALHHYIKNDTALMWTARASVFVLVLVVLMIIGALIASQIKTGPLTLIDRSLGFVYGLFRGYVLVCLVYLVMVMILWPDIDRPQPPPESATEQTQAEKDKDKDRNVPPELLMKAHTRAAMAFGAGMLKNLIPQEMIDKKLDEYANQKNAVQKEIDRQTLENLSTPKPPEPESKNAEQGHINIFTLAPEKKP